MVKKFFICASMLLLTGCVYHQPGAKWHSGWSVELIGETKKFENNYKRLAKGWIGQSLKSLTDAWGQPTRMEYGIDGQMEVTYVTMRLTSVCHNNNMMQQSYQNMGYYGGQRCQPQQIVNCKTVFKVNDTGAYVQDTAQQIIDVDFRGAYCGL